MPRFDALRRLYVAVMLQVVSRSLAAASRVDPVLRSELAALPAGFEVCMVVLPCGPAMAVRANGDGTVDRVRPNNPPNGQPNGQPNSGKPRLSIRFKHLEHAFLVLSFQEGTAQAFANSRMVADGDVAAATRLVRCLDRLESLILPAFVARRAVKRYLPLRLGEKLPLAMRVYGRVLLGAFGGGVR